MDNICDLAARRNIGAHEEWRALLRVSRLVRDIARAAGPRHAARQGAYALASAPVSVRHAVLAVLAAQIAKGEEPLPDVRQLQHEVDALAAFTQIRPQPPRQPHARRHDRRERREPLPVDVARAVSLDVLAERLGLELHRRGRQLLVRCPFHEDRHPSLRLDLRKGLWHCFPCGAGGDGITLVMRLRGVSFADAVREVAA